MDRVFKMNPVHPKKGKFLERLAEENSVAVVVLNERGETTASANDNSICRLLYDTRPENPCAKFCGKAFENTANGRPFDYECHAGLQCRAVPVVDNGISYVAIVGRIFNRGEAYREATDKAINGEWSGHPPSEFFENVLISGSDDGIGQAAERLRKFIGRERNDLLEIPPPVLRKPAKPAVVAASVTENAGEDENGESAAWRSLFGSLMQMTYGQAVAAVLRFVSDRYGFSSAAWYENRDGRFAIAEAVGDIANRRPKINLSAADHAVAASLAAAEPISLRPRKSVAHLGPLHLFPVAIGDNIIGAVVIDTPAIANEISKRIYRFARIVASPLEILRLRSEVLQRDWLSRAVIKFNEHLRNIDGEDFWLRLAQVSAELLHAERASILIRDEKSRDLQAKAAIGSRIDLLSEKGVGSRVARHVLDAGDPVLVANIDSTGMKRAPYEWSYKTDSFISYPIIIGDRKVGILNFTDKAGGDVFNGKDLQLLEAIAPQIAVAIDRTRLKDKAGQFQQLSVTDTLTGLLNRRYLEERLTEEITRSRRHHFPMSLMMLDVDSFKSYNDSFGHPAGDRALKIVADVLKETLRGADVAARYGGEEFAVLLPQTAGEEATRIAERIRQKIERTAFPLRPVTVSIGIASCSNEIANANELISAADVALYQAKNNGRNMVRSFGEFGNTLNENIH